MQVADFLRLYRLSPELQTLSARLLGAAQAAEKAAPNEGGRGGLDAPGRLHLRGLVGSQEAVVAAATAPGA